jgi:hypothetical protein
MYCETLDDSELTRLLELLDANGFDVQNYKTHGYAGVVTRIELTVYPREDNGSKDEGNGS